MSPLAPIAAALIAAVFAFQLGRQYVAKRRAHALAWCISLALFCTAHVAVLVGISAGWTPSVFAVYWLCGALLNVPWLATGQLHLLDRRRSVLWWTLAGLATVWCVVFAVTAAYDAAALAEATRSGVVPLGRDVLGGTTAYALLRPMTYTSAIVVFGSTWSAVRTRRWAVLLIALGVVVAAAGSSLIPVGGGELFPVLSAAGVGLMYVGFRAASRVAPVAVPVTA